MGALDGPAWFKSMRMHIGKVRFQCISSLPVIGVNCLYIDPINDDLYEVF